MQFPMGPGSKIVSDVLEVEVDLNDDRVILEAALFAGLIGSTISDSGMVGRAGGQWDGLQPAVWVGVFHGR